jgi:hypothetical protein
MKKGLFIFAVALLLFPENNAGATLITVDAFSSSVKVGELPNTIPGVGLDTGIYLAAGQTFSVSVDPNDLWNAGKLPRWSNADGLIADRLATIGDDSGEPAGTLIGTNFGLWTYSGLSAPYGALVGEIGGTFFLLGTNFSGPAPVSGTLRLFFWDENNYDNADKINVNIRAISEPGAFILLALGLLALTAFARHRHEPRGGKPRGA